MKPAAYNFEILQGKDFSKSFIWKTKDSNGNYVPVDMTGYHFKWEIVPQNSAQPKIIWQDQEANPVIDTSHVAQGRIEVDVPNTVTASYNFINAFHELTFIAPSGKIYQFLKGDCKLVKDL